MDLLGELLGLGADILGTLDNLARENLEVLLNGLLEVIDGGLLGLLLDSVAASLDDGSVVVAATAVPGEDVGGVAGNVAEGTDGTDGNKSLLELLGGDGSNGVFRV